MEFLMREALMKDSSQLKELAGHFYLGSLSADLKDIEDKIKISQDSFKKKIPIENRNFLFVLEDLAQRKIIGSSQILSAFGKNNSPCFLLIEEDGKKYLKLTKNRTGKHQMGGLILHFNYRHAKERLGLLLGGIRFLYINSYPEDFSKILEVNLTPPFKIKERYSAFWEEVGRKYIDEDVITGLDLYRKEKIDFFSRFPKNLKISLESLSREAKQCLQSVHSETQPAYEALLKLGFYKTNKYHFIDGGLFLESEVSKISLISQTQKVVLKTRDSKADPKADSLYLVGQETSMGFIGSFIKGFLEGDDFYFKEEASFFEEGRPAFVKNCSLK